MGYLKEYIDKKMSFTDLQVELHSLILKYNDLRNTFLFIFASDLSKHQIPDISICQKDYYTIFDLLSHKNDIKAIDIYIETPGGSGEAAEEIIKFFRKYFETVNFVIAGEAKSAGTIIVLSGDNILMTETASLGPIDAQIMLGRTIISASDYMEWVRNKQKEAQKNNALNTFDAIIIAQITPGELLSIENSLEYAKDIVKDNLEKYKFRNWEITETTKHTVTPEKRRARAKKIAGLLSNHSLWRSHGRSIKREDLVSIGLKITNIEENSELSEIVHRINIILRLMFESSSIYKMFLDQDNFIARRAISKEDTKIAPQQASVVEIEANCGKCSKKFSLYGKFEDDPKIDTDMKKRGLIMIPKEGILKCDNCGFEIDLMGIINQIESQVGKKMIF